MTTNQSAPQNSSEPFEGDITDQPINNSQDATLNDGSSDPEQSTQTSELENRIAELTQDLQRTRADFENYRKQIEAQKTNLATSVAQSTVEKFLPLLDDFYRAISTYPEQLAPIEKNFNKSLQSLQLSQIDSSVGVEFNPDLHDAISIEDGDGDTEIIAETLRPGYLYNGDVIRAAMVKVKRA